MAEQWRASQDTEGGWTSIFTERTGVIAHVFVEDNEPLENLMPRANLMAAAPALLAACEEALRIVGIPRPSAQAVALDRAEEVFRNAIAMARGGAK